MSGDKQARRFDIAKSNEWPSGALSWRNATEKGHRRRAWRQAVWRLFRSRGRTVTLAWALETLSGARGFAFASDAALARECDLPVNKVQAALTEMERAGAIVRCHVSKGQAFERRIFLGAGIISAAADTPQVGGGGIPPKLGLPDTPQVGGREERGRGNRRGLGATLDAARADAERRDARARGDSPGSWLLDDEADAA